MRAAAGVTKAVGSMLQHGRIAGGWWIAEFLFVAGWSLLWASALGLVSFVPVTICAMLMLFGALLPGILLRASSNGRHAPNHPN